MILKGSPLARPAGATFDDLADEYLGSPDYLTKADRTRGEYLKILRKLRDLIGDMPLGRLGGEAGVEYVRALQVSLQKHPRHCNHTLAVLSLVCAFGVGRRRLSINPALGVRRLPVSPRRAVWGFEDQDRFLAAADPTMRLAFLLGLYTAQRQGDLLRLGWSQYDGERITLTQGKTNRTVRVLVMEPLRAALRAALRVEEHVLVDRQGRPFRQRQFEAVWSETTRTAGITSGVRFQDLRRTAMTRMAEASATETEMAAVSGHSIDRSRQILQTYVVATTPMADSAIRKWAEREKTLRSL